MRLLLDTNLLLRLCHPAKHPDVKAWFGSWLALAQASSDIEITIAAAADYELRRGYLWKLGQNADARKALERLDALGKLLGVEPISEKVLQDAAIMWADARRKGYSTAAERDIDWDVIIAAQAKGIAAVVVTSNAQHLLRHGVDARDWQQIPIPEQESRG